MISEQEFAPPPHPKLRSSHALKWDYAICNMYHHCEALPLSLLKGKADNEAQTNYVQDVFSKIQLEKDIYEKDI